MGDLQFIDRSINAVAFENKIYALPAVAKELLGNMRKIASGKQVIPDCLKVRDRLNCTLSMYKMLIFLQLHAEELITAGELDEYNFGANSNKLGSGSAAQCAQR
jgi:hypothetical protein